MAGLYRERVLPHLINCCCGSEGFRSWRADTCAELHGRVVEIGFGSGLNVEHYPDGVAEVVAVEPSSVAVRLASDRIARSPVPVRLVGLDGQSLPLDDASCDTALCTFTLCTVPDPAAALAEVVRVLAPGGTLHFLEHGLAPDPGVVRWQRRIEPFQRRLADGCHLTRDPLALASRVGFTVVGEPARTYAGPRPWSYLTRAVVARPD
jgi:SAM-dependent methyltransferase